MSSSDSDDDAQMALFREAADTEFLSDKMFKEVGQNKSSVDVEKVKIQEKSQRYLNENESVKDDLNVPETMKNFVYTKLSKMIENSTKFIDVPSKQTINTETHYRSSPSLKLLNDTEIITDFSSNGFVEEMPKKFQKPKRRHLSEEFADICENDKIKNAAINFEDISKGTECWKLKKRSKVFEYHRKNKTLHLNEPETEFFATRKRNNWTESKIAQKRTKKVH